jgi:vacuolar-type H+-ATPase subunit H
MKQTAVEWLEKKLHRLGLSSFLVEECINQAKEMDKQQKKDAFISAREYIHTTMFKYENAEQYYEETYGKETEKQS